MKKRNPEEKICGYTLRLTFKKLQVLKHGDYLIFEVKPYLTIFKCILSD